MIKIHNLCWWLITVLNSKEYNLSTMIECQTMRIFTIEQFINFGISSHIYESSWAIRNILLQSLGEVSLLRFSRGFFTRPRSKWNLWFVLLSSLQLVSKHLWEPKVHPSLCHSKQISVVQEVEAREHQAVLESLHTFKQPPRQASGNKEGKGIQ